MNHELPDVQAGFIKGRGTRDQIANICWIIDKAIQFQKNIYFCFFDYAKAFDCVDHSKLWKILQEMGTPEHLICLLKNLYASQEATVRTGHGTTDWFQIGKGVRQGSVSSPWLFDLWAAIYGVAQRWTRLKQLSSSMQTTSCKMPGWMKHKLGSRLPGEISITSDIHVIPHLGQKVKRN